VDKVVQEVLPIALLIGAIVLVVRFLPRVDVGHSDAFRMRRVANWLPLGLTYAFLYMGRYNLNGLLKYNLLSPGEFGTIDAIGSVVYGLAFLLNGPLTDRWGGRVTILIAAAGAAVCNAAIGMSIATTGQPPEQWLLILLFALNMYFQSFGAVAIVKVNASWFHLRERGTFGGIFGILISLGIYFAFDWAPKIAELTSIEWLFLAPAAILAVFWVISFLLVRDTPGETGHVDFDVADASSGEEGPPPRALQILKRLLTNRVILVIAFISFCSGFVRQAILKWAQKFGAGVHIDKSWAMSHWGMVGCMAGILGGIFAGTISDHVFKSRRPPVVTVLFAIVLVGAIAILPLLAVPAVVPFVIAFMMLAIIGVHGMLSGVVSQDFGGRRAAGTATGLIDGFVYFGTALQAVVYGNLLPTGEAANDSSNWHVWPLAMLPAAVVGLALSISVYNARVRPKSASH
jgi:OPA family glycerol-3-phosphate transporter-like MFS transporter